MKFKQNVNIFTQEKTFENVVCEMPAILFRPQCVKAINNIVNNTKVYVADLLTDGDCLSPNARLIDWLTVLGNIQFNEPAIKIN